MVSLCFSLGVCGVVSSCLSPLAILSSFFLEGWVAVWVSSNFSDYLWVFNFPTSTCCTDCLFPIVYSYFLRQRLTIGLWVCAWGFHSFPLPHRSVSLPGPPCFEYCSSVVLCGVWEGYAPCFVPGPQNGFGSLGVIYGSL